jgi:hypothetical protein
MLIKRQQRNGSSKRQQQHRPKVSAIARHERSDLPE